MPVDHLDNDVLAALPKAHLHLHLVGSMRPSTLAELCVRDGRPVPRLDLDAGGWSRFNALYEAASASITCEADLRRLVQETVEDQRRDGVRWVEITADPSNYHGRIGAAEHVLDVLLDEGRRASARHGVEIGWVVCANRSRPPVLALRLAELAAGRAGDGVVGFGLANNERAAPTAAFIRAFATARDAGLAAVPHAGELCGAHSVREAVTLLGACRIGHGVRCLEDEATVRLVLEAGVTLEVCPTSNLALGVCDARWSDGGPTAHPIERLHRAGVKLCLNADDPLLFGAGLLDEYRFAHTELGWDRHDLATSAEASIRAAACPEPLRRELERDLAGWRARHTTLCAS